MADAHGSGPCESNLMRVQVPSPARTYKRRIRIALTTQCKFTYDCGVRAILICRDSVTRNKCVSIYECRGACRYVQYSPREHLR